MSFVLAFARHNREHHNSNERILIYFNFTKMKKSNLKSIESSLLELKTRLEAENLRTDITAEEKKHLSIVYSVLTEHYNGKSRVLDLSCGSCIQIALKQAQNHVLHQDGKGLFSKKEPKKTEAETETPSESLPVVSESGNVTTQTRQELLEAYKARFGKAAPPNMKTSNIAKKIAESDASK